VQSRWNFAIPLEATSALLQFAMLLRDSAMYWNRYILLSKFLKQANVSKNFVSIFDESYRLTNASECWEDQSRFNRYPH